MEQDTGVENGERRLEEGVRTDFTAAMSYADYLGLDTLLASQHPLSDPVHPDEMLFIIQHQTTELWFKLIIQELSGARDFLDADNNERARKSIARVKHIMRTLAEQWSVLATLTPSEYAEFRGVLGSASGFQSAQYRAVEFLLGNKNASMLRLFAEGTPERELVEGALRSPTVYDAFLRALDRSGLVVPANILERDVSQAWVEHPELIGVFEQIYRDPAAHWEAYATCEDLVDLEDAFQFWRFRHLRTVQRTIGFKTGTGGSTGVDFLKRALELTFFPELITVRTHLK
jgi:tryptophan 2,3-dioxygenase